MNSVVYSLASRGLQADLISVEVENYRSNPGFVVVGLGDTAVQESRERVRAAIKNSGFRFPRGKVVVNLAPADIHKSGPCFDLPIALGLVALGESLILPDLKNMAFFGELALDGSLRHVDGVLGMVAEAKDKGIQTVFVPLVNAAEAAMIENVTVYGVETLKDVINHLCGFENLEEKTVERMKELENISQLAVVDMKVIKGQAFAKRALEIAAAGGHNILMNGSPGSGKSLLAKAFRGILPPLTLDESLEVTKVYSLAGLLPKDDYLMRQRPFRIIHHTASGASLVGGGRIPMPGEISLAHRGVLFVDEMSEFPSHVLDLLRQPMEDRQITISRTSGSLTYPAQFLLCGAMNPCPCGYYNVPNSQRECSCTPNVISRYKSKLSGPLMDRIDLYCSVSPVKYDDLSSEDEAETSENVLKRVLKAREKQTVRFKGKDLHINSEMSPKHIAQFCTLEPDAQEVLEIAMRVHHLSARGYHRVLKVARTVADLEGSEKVSKDHLCEALQYRHDGGK
ncbi:MAG: YifB family Mg chelatase-like AAA ATPase [Candidatus Gracilibacteria bacterium]|nr:YifB family Mg chelatase-like AAA ATPase [Candidatus Gracilibacteria bacterium]